MDVQDKVAFVTGGGTGIGRAVALALRAGGAQVVVGGRREAPLRELAVQEGIEWVGVDVSDPGQVAASIERVLELHGRLDILVNNAGVYSVAPLEETSEESLQLLWEVNVAGVLRVSRAALPALRESRGAIVNISSIVARGVFPGAVAYSASKAAVEHATRVLAAEVGPQGVRVNAVAPGPTETPMTEHLLADSGTVAALAGQTPLGRIGRPEDVAPAVVFLASPAASWVTGEVLSAAGGLTL